MQNRITAKQTTRRNRPVIGRAADVIILQSYSYALVVCALAVMSLSGRHHAVTLDWVVFVIHSVVVIGAVLFVTFFRMGRLF